MSIPLPFRKPSAHDRARQDWIDERLRDHAWFIAFAPAEAPKIAVAIMVENGRSGSGTAAPIARRVIDTYLLGAPTTELPARKAIAGAAAPPPATE